jgi:serine/threonine protein phosphatase PrpC
MKYRYAISTATGARKYNQDRAACMEGDRSVLLILGDGLGGHAGGDIAADLLVDTAQRAFLKIRTPVIAEPSLFLALIMQHAHRAIKRLIHAQPQSSALCRMDMPIGHMQGIADCICFVIVPS